MGPDSGMPRSFLDSWWHGGGCGFCQRLVTVEQSQNKQRALLRVGMRSSAGLSYEIVQEVAFSRSEEARRRLQKKNGAHSGEYAPSYLLSATLSSCLGLEFWRPCVTSSVRLKLNLLLAADEREHRSLRILSLNDPASSGYLHRAVEDLAAAGLDSFNGSVDRVDVEIEAPA